MQPAVTIKNYLDDFLHLFFPHTCVGCGTDVLNNDSILCAKCIDNLPATGFLSNQNNPIEKIFYGRLKVESAGSIFYFNKTSLLQQLVFQFKYRNNRQAAIFLGKMMGKEILYSNRFNDVDVIIPLPLNKVRQYKRGYNQAELLAQGITEVWRKPIINNAVERSQLTETQTRKNRIVRWQTMENVFSVIDKTELINKHVLLIDDIITTGATLEACGNAISKVAGVKLSIVTLAYTIKN